MWYYTKFNIDAPEEIVKEILEVSWLEQDDLDDTLKWYDQTEDVSKVAIKHPDVLITVSWKWEESWDIWKEYFRWDKFQRCKAKIVFDECTI